MIVDRADLLAHARTVVVKIGSGVLAAEGGRGLSLAAVAELARDVQAVRKREVRIVLVSSGAILAGIPRLGLSGRPSSLAEHQAAAAIGQSALMQAYENCFGTWGGKVAQVLLTGQDLAVRVRFNNARQTLRVLLDRDVVPVINENDTVVTDEITCGDNDKLAALIVNLVEADLLIMLSIERGIYTSDPREPGAALLPLVRDVDALAAQVGEPRPNSAGRGGVASKLAAAKVAARYGVPTVVTDGREPDVLRRLFGGEELGTLIMPGTDQLGSRKHWIAFGSKPVGSLVVDAGAARALRRGGVSLLPKGVISVNGSWDAGELVEIVDEQGNQIGRGLAGYSAGDCSKLIGQPTERIPQILGRSNGEELVHADNLVLSETTEE